MISGERHNSEVTKVPVVWWNLDASRWVGVIFWFLALVLGLFLRLYLLDDQILLDDEWHGLNFVSNKTWFEIATSYNPLVHSSPLYNLYRLWLYQFWGWSENALRLPAILAGVLGLILLPFFIRRWLGAVSAGIFTLLLAISPFLIFYSRFSRPYSAMALLTMTVLFLGHGWLTTGRRGYAAGYILCSALAVYSHLFSLMVVAAPIVFAGVVLLGRRSAKMADRFCQMRIGWRSWLVVAIILAGPVLAAMLPAISHSSQLPWARGAFPLQGILNALTLCSGTANTLLILVFFGLAILGLWRLFCSAPLLAGLVSTVFVFYLVSLAMVRPDKIEHGIVIMRYAIVFVPLALTLVSHGLADLHKLITARTNWPQTVNRLVIYTAALLLAGALWAAGPLSQTYTRPNNFSNHSAFQGSYEKIDWKRSEARHISNGLPVSEDEIPVFYHQLVGRPEVNTIIEYPLEVTNHNNLFYYYQHFHKKKVIAGYCSQPGRTTYGLRQAPPTDTIIISWQVADLVLQQVKEPDKLRFANMVDLTNPQAIMRSQADLIILHKYIYCLTLTKSGDKFVKLFNNYQQVVLPIISQLFDKPVYEDEHILVFKVRSGPKSK